MGLGERRLQYLEKYLEKYVLFRGLIVLQRSCPWLHFFHTMFFWRCFCQKNTPGGPAFQQRSGCQFLCPVFCCLQDIKAVRELAAWHLLPPTEVPHSVPQLPLLTLLHAIRNLLTTDFWCSCHSLLNPGMSLHLCMAASASRTSSMHQAYLISCWLRPGITWKLLPCSSSSCFYIPRLGANNEIKGKCDCTGMAETEKNGSNWWNKEVLINILLRSSCLRTSVERHVCKWPSGCQKNIMRRYLSLYATVTIKVGLPVNKSRM